MPIKSPAACLPSLVIASVLMSPLASGDEEIIVRSHTSSTDAGFSLGDIPKPLTNDAATNATFTLVSGEGDGNSGALAVLHDGQVPQSDDQPSANFFFAPGFEGGRIRIDLDEKQDILAVRSYSWHSAERGPQVYRLFAAAGDENGLDPAPAARLDPAERGWTLIANVDTRPEEGDGGGQHAASIQRGDDSPLGSFRHLLLDISSPSDTERFAQTFFSEIDVVTANDPDPQPVATPERIVRTYPGPEGTYTYVVDMSKAPDLAEWVEAEMVPLIQEWYPKLVEMLPSDGYTAPDTVGFEFKDDMGGTPAYAAGNRISLNVGWFRGQLEREAKGCVVHEMVHVVQNYWRARVGNRRPNPNPGWIVEGIADYVRWFIYEPESRGAEITARNFASARYDGSYRISANFLDWVARTHGEDIFVKLNAACREGRYSDDLWIEWTGKTVTKLGEDWKAYHEERITAR